jgi:DNA polymerase-1
MRPLATVDFETEGVEVRPKYPPVPTGVAIRYPSGKLKYWSWGHPSENNCTKYEAIRELQRIYRRYRILFYHGQFDLDVGNVHLGLPLLKDFEDGLYIAFLKDPHQRSLELKELAPKQLNMPADARDELRDWIVENIEGANKGKRKWKEYICKAPGKLVGKYACADAEMTFRYFEAFYPEIEKRSMKPAYRREVKCLPITLEMERGLRINASGLEQCGEIFQEASEDIYKKIRSKLGVKAGFNLNSGQQLGQALQSGGFLKWIQKTPSGLVATGMDVLKKTCKDKDLVNLLGMHSVLQKSMNTFIYPWLNQAQYTGGRICPHYNQTAGGDEDSRYGTRSGRYSSSNPNLQQVSANVEESKNRDLLMILQAYLKERFDFKFTGLRAFLLPDKGSVLISVDYGQQEIRLLAHFERGELMEHFRRDPNFDLHTFIQKFIQKQTGIEYPRKFIKITVFSIIYGAGVKKIQMQLDTDWKTAETVYQGVFAAVPGLKRLIEDLKELERQDLPLTTWGGREYLCEPDHYDADKDRWYEFGYKMLNYQIQPSAADLTKEGMIQVADALPDCRIAGQVHDELLVMAPSRSYGPKVVHAMCDLNLNVPIIAEPKYSRVSWGAVAA